MKASCPELARVMELLDKLEQRAHSCRGLFPVQTQLEFLNLSSTHQLGRFVSTAELARLKPGDLHQISLDLERFWRDPSLCQQVLAQCLLQHRPAPLKTYQPGSSSRQSWLAVVQEGLALSTETACQDKQLKSA